MSHTAYGGANYNTPEGGRAFTLVNASGGQLATGDLVELARTAGRSLVLAQPGTANPLGIAYEYVNAGEECWVVTDGIQTVTLEAGTTCRPGDQLCVSPTQPGRVRAGTDSAVIGWALGWNDVNDQTLAMIKTVPSGSPWVNVLAFGACGNGVADDTVAIQTAITAAASAGGGVVLFPSGTYPVSASLVVPSGVVLCGMGRSSVLLAVGTINMVYFDGTGVLVQDASIEFLSLIGNNTAAAPGGPGLPTVGNGVVCSGGRRVRVNDCYFSNFGDVADTGTCAVLFWNDNLDVTILNNYATGGLGALNGADFVVYSAGGDAIIVGNRAYSVNSAGIYVNATAASVGRVIVSGNISKNHNRHGIIADYAGVGRMSTAVSSNVCVDCCDTGIYVAAPTSKGFAVVGNVVDSCAGGAVVSNSAYLSGGIVLAGGVAGSGLTRKVVTGNVITNTGRTSAGAARPGYPDGPVTLSAALRIVNDDDSVVVGNMIDQSIGEGISLYNNIRKALVQSNEIVNAETYAICINVNAAVRLTMVDISRNFIDQTGCDGQGIHLIGAPAGADSYLVEHNTILGHLVANKTGIYTVHDVNGRICDNMVDNWALGVDFPNTVVSAVVGAGLAFERNTMQNCTVGMNTNLAAGVFAFGVDNRYRANGTNEVSSGVANYKNAACLVHMLGGATRTKVWFDTAPPATGTWAVGDMVYNSAPPAAPGVGYAGWVCVVAGVGPGATWRPFGALV
jgi:hypothetical protein